MIRIFCPFLTTHPELVHPFVVLSANTLTDTSIGLLFETFWIGVEGVGLVCLGLVTTGSGRVSALEVSETTTFGGSFRGVVVVVAAVVIVGRRLGPSKVTDATSDAGKESSRRRSPSPTTTTNLPSVKVVIRPLIILPSLRRIVSARAVIDKIEMSANETSHLPIELCAFINSSVRESGAGVFGTRKTDAFSNYQVVTNSDETRLEQHYSTKNRRNVRFCKVFGLPAIRGSVVRSHDGRRYFAAKWGKKMRNRKFIGSVFIALIALLATGSFAAERLGGGRWQLVELNGKKLANSQIYVEFDEEKMRLSGHAGCNRFFGAYGLTGNNVALTGIGSTKMACMQPGVMRTEAAFLRALSDATKIRENGMNLRIFIGNKRAMRFKRMPRKPVENASDLTSMKWMLSSIRGKRISLANDQPFLNFDASKKSAGGNSGCNVFGGNYETEGSSIKFSELISTMRACEFEDRMSIEREYLDGLRRADRFEIKGGRLVLFTGKETLLEFSGVKK